MIASQPWWRGGCLQRSTGFQPFEQLRKRHAEDIRDFQEVPEANIFLAALDLADVRPVKASDVGELLLQPCLGGRKPLNSFAEPHQ